MYFIKLFLKRKLELYIKFYLEDYGVWSWKMELSFFYKEGF